MTTALWLQVLIPGWLGLALLAGALLGALARHGEQAAGTLRPDARPEVVPTPTHEQPRVGATT